MALRRFLLLAVGVLAVAGCASQKMPTDGSATVVEVVDGDTIVVDLGPVRETVRLLGVDTPETKHPTKPVECYGHEASDFTAQLLPKGTHVRLKRDQEARDSFGRFLAYVYRADDGLFVNLELARQGYADALVIAPNDAYAPQIRAAVGDAHARGLGLWGTCGGPDVPVEPP